MGIEHMYNAEALQEQEARARLVVENAGNLIATLNLEGHFLFCSPSYRTILGYAPEELIGSDAFLLIHPDDLALARQAMTRALAGVVDTATLRVRHKDGHYLTFVGTIKAIPTTQGTPSQFVSIQHDITERQQAEEERGRLLETLATEHARLEAILRHLPSGVLVAEAPTGTVVLCNQQVEQILGRPVRFLQNIDAYSEWVGWHLDGRPVQPDEWPLARAVRGQAWSEELRCQRGNGTFCYIRVRGAPLIDQAGTVIAGMVTLDDITEQKELEREKEAVLGIVTHELRTPLTTMQVSMQLAQRRLQRVLALLDPLTTPHQRLREVLLTLTRSEGQLHLQNRLISDLWESSRLQAGNLELRKQPSDLARIVAETVRDQQMVHPTRSIILERSTPEPILVLVDRDRIGQVLNNYITNALKYSQEDQPVVVGISHEGHQARVWVRDHGPGLSASAQQQIWERFYQAPGITAQNGSEVGLGLGLAICQALIRSHEGQVGLESTEGQGSVFWFMLPLL